MRKFFIKIIFLILFFNHTVFALQSKVLDFQSWQTTNSAEVYFMPAPELPMLDIIIQFKAGSAYDDERQGRASFTASQLGKGTRLLDEETIAEKFDAMGAQFSASAGKDAATIHLRSLTDVGVLHDAIDLFTEVLINPSFPQTEFDRDQQRLVIALRQQEQLPGYIAEQAFYHNLYRQHPYANPVAGTSTSVALLTREDIIAFYQRYYVAHNAVVTIVGDITRTRAEQIAAQITAGLSNSKALIALEPVEPLTEGVQQHINFPSEQTHIWLGTIGIDKHDPRFFPLLVGNYMLGGQPLVAQLFEEVREKRGLAYSVRSRLMPMLKKGPFLVNLQTRNDQAQQALEVVEQTITEFLQNGFSDEQLEKAKKGLIGGFPLNFSGNAAIAGQLANIGFYNLPENYLDTYRSNIQQVTNEDIIAAFNQIVDMNELVIVTVGN